MEKRMIMKRFVLFLFMFSVYYTSLDAADNGQMNTGRMNQCIDDHIRNREKTYYGYEHVKKEIEDLRKRLDYVMQWHAQTKIAPFDLVIIEDYGNIILFAGGNMYFLFFEPISFFYGYDSRSSYSLLATEVWNISPELKKAIDCFKRARKIVTEKETEGRFDETNSPLLQMGLKCGWRYYLSITCSPRAKENIWKEAGIWHKVNVHIGQTIRGIIHAIPDESYDLGSCPCVGRHFLCPSCDLWILFMGRHACPRSEGKGAEVSGRVAARYSERSIHTA